MMRHIVKEQLNKYLHSMWLYSSLGGEHKFQRFKKKIQIDFWKWFFWQKMMKIEYFCIWNIEWNLLKWPSTISILRLEQYCYFTLRNTTTHRFNDENPTGLMQDLRCVNGVMFLHISTAISSQIKCYLSFGCGKSFIPTIMIGASSHRLNMI